MIEMICKLGILGVGAFVTMVVMCLVHLGLCKLNEFVEDGDESKNIAVVFLVLVILGYIVAGDAVSAWLATTWVGAK